MEAGSEVVASAPAPRRRKGKGDLAIPEAVGLSVEARALELAIKQAAPLEQLEKFMQLKRQHEANEERKAFNKAFAAFKAESVTIMKGTKITDGPLKGKSHANLFDVVSATTPALSKHGLTIAWKLSKDDPQWMEVTCTLRHDAGHSESVSMGGAPDTGPGRNAIQARGSTKSYLERYTATAILGLAAQDADDDGKGGKAGDAVSKEQLATLEAKLDEINVSEKDRKQIRGDLCKYLQIDSLDVLPTVGYGIAIHAIEVKRKAVERDRAGK